MKLLYCKKCHDIFRIYSDEFRLCNCKESGGKYVSELKAVYFGNYAIPLGLDNWSFGMALQFQPFEGDGKKFDAFVIPKTCSTFIKVDKLE